MDNLMENKTYKMFLSSILIVMLIVTFSIIVLWINNSNILSEAIFYFLWIIAIIIALILFMILKKYNISKLLEIGFFIITIILTSLLFLNFIIYYITLSMP